VIQERKAGDAVEPCRQLLHGCGSHIAVETQRRDLNAHGINREDTHVSARDSNLRMNDPAAEQTRINVKKQLRGIVARTCAAIRQDGSGPSRGGGQA
jgi:hypothetical protein